MDEESASVTLSDVAAGSVARDVEAALGEAQPADRDAGAVALARRYAYLIDEAAPAANYGEPLRVLRAAVHTRDEHQALQRITDALSAHSVASDLGPKLLAALAALGMTPASRQVKGGEPPGARIAAQLDEFTARRARKHGS
jgi:hypothetical protein